MKLLAYMLALTASISAAWADDAHHPQGNHEQAAAGGFAPNEGEIRKLDKDQGKLTIKHGPLPGVDMPAMTMVFRVKDPAMLEQVAVGDKVKLQVAKINGAFTVTELVPSN